MKTIKIANYSIYSDGWYDDTDGNFVKLYKGVRVNVNKSGDDPRYMHFSIRTTKVKNTIWKKENERMDSIVFSDADNSITCDYEDQKRKATPHTLAFEKPVYEELKENIPAYMKECGLAFDTIVEDGRTILKF